MLAMRVAARARRLAAARSRLPARLLSTVSTSENLPPALLDAGATDLIPEDVVRELNKNIVGQEEAKKAVAVALRNRWRRRQLSDPTLRAEIAPMNILMSGPTGTGKTEIARRLAKLANSPFLKVEATKYTEVGIYGANAESMIKDLVDVAVDMERDRVGKAHAAAARERAINRLVDLLGGEHKPDGATREKLREQIASGAADNRQVQLKLKPLRRNARKNRSDMMEMPVELEDMMSRLSSHLGGGKDESSKWQRMSVKDALPKLEAEEAEQFIDEEEVVKNAIESVQHNGIIFLDEIDKLATDDHRGGGGDYRKGEGVQKELLALTEGCAVNTRYGLVYTDHILFIASGAFHRCNPSDLMPELQGRLPIRVALSPLGQAEFVRILKETEHNLLHQTQELMKTEGVELSFTDEAIEEIAAISAQVNAQTDDIGARRLATIVSKITEEVSFHAPKMRGIKFEVDKTYVRQRLANVLEKTDLTKYIL